MKKYIFWLFACTISLTALAQSNASLAPTPPMGWNSWNLVEDQVSDAIIREIADAMVKNGMLDAGYQYIILDDFWVGGRDTRNNIFPDPIRFPHGMKSLADYVHSKGLKLGIYSDAAPLTCGGVTGSLGFEEQDAKTFAAWGIDYLKYDYCGAPADRLTAINRYKKMGDALRATGRPIVYAVCEWGQRQPWLWARAVGAQLWRTTWDSRDVWQSNDSNLTGIMEIFDQQDSLASYGGNGGWNDPDLLMVGLFGKGKSSSANGRFKGCNLTEYNTHFALWCMLAAPLIVNLDVRNMDAATASILLNKDLIAINQDKAGKQGFTIWRNQEIQVLKKELANDEVAICVFNRSESEADFSLNILSDLHVYYPCLVGNATTQKMEKNSKVLSGKLPAHGCVVYRISPKL